MSFSNRGIKLEGQLLSLREKESLAQEGDYKNIAKEKNLFTVPAKKYLQSTVKMFNPNYYRNRMVP